jgi:hypothetical protein
MFTTKEEAEKIAAQLPLSRVIKRDVDDYTSLWEVETFPQYVGKIVSG